MNRAIVFRRTETMKKKSLLAMYKGSVRNCKKKRTWLPFITIVKYKFKTVSFIQIREGHGLM